MAEREKNPQPEAEEKQAGWVENGRMGENPQPEAKRSKRFALVNKFWTRNIKK